MDGREYRIDPPHMEAVKFRYDLYRSGNVVGKWQSASGTFEVLDDFKLAVTEVLGSNGTKGGFIAYSQDDELIVCLVPSHACGIVYRFKNRCAEIIDFLNGCDFPEFRKVFEGIEFLSTCPGLDLNRPIQRVLVRKNWTPTMDEIRVCLASACRLLKRGTGGLREFAAIARRSEELLEDFKSILETLDPSLMEELTEEME